MPKYDNCFSDEVDYSTGEENITIEGHEEKSDEKPATDGIVTPIVEDNVVTEQEEGGTEENVAPTPQQTKESEHIASTDSGDFFD